MKKISISNIILFIVALLLLGGCLYFFNESRKPDNKIVIGIPANEEITYYGDAIDSKEDANYIRLALMSSISIDKPEISKKLPDATIRIDDTDIGATYLFTDVWFDNDKVIFALGGKDDPYGTEYKETVGDFGKDIINYISKYKPK